MRRIKHILFVLIALICHAFSRSHDTVGKNDADHQRKESKQLNPVRFRIVYSIFKETGD